MVWDLGRKAQGGPMPSLGPAKPCSLGSTELQETTGGEFRVCRAFYKASTRYIDLLSGLYQ